MKNHPLKIVIFIGIGISALAFWKASPATTFGFGRQTANKGRPDNDSSLSNDIDLQSSRHETKSQPDSSSKERSDAMMSGKSKSSNQDDNDSEHDLVVDNQSSDDEVFEASDEIQAAMDVWNLEKEAFYRDEIGLDASIIDQVHKMSVKTGDSIQSIVSAITSNPPKITEDDYQYALARLKEEESQSVRTLVGDDQFKKIVAFRENWNAEIESRFGIRFRVAGF